ncbi:hypothetical protein ABPG75_001970 [Micractinium tetrahymenae]
MAAAAAAQAVPPFLPQCSSASQLEFQSGWSAGGTFELTAAYVREDVVPSAIPGFVLGGLALLGFCVTFAALLLSACCCCWRRSSGGGKQGPAAATWAQPATQSRRAKRLSSRRGRAFWALLALLAVGTAGVGVWGLVETLSKTSHIASGFWDLVADTRAQVDSTVQAIRGLQSGAASLSSAAAVLAPTSK